MGVGNLLSKTGTPALPVIGRRVEASTGIGILNHYRQVWKVERLQKLKRLAAVLLDMDSHGSVERVTCAPGGLLGRCGTDSQQCLLFKWMQTVVKGTELMLRNQSVHFAQA